jgi:hypothetical protein
MSMMLLEIIFFHLALQSEILKETLENLQKNILKPKKKIIFSMHNLFAFF